MAVDLWQLAHRRRSVHVFSTIFTAQSVERHLNTESGIERAIDWCRRTGVTKVYMESFRNALLAQRANLVRARDRFREAGLEVSGCVTTTDMAKKSEVGWDQFPCFTSPATQRQLEEIFTYTAALFDEIMIDDFYCTACECAECQAARGERSWADYRLPLMHQVSRDRVLAPARATNPKVRIIIKYPQWYEQFHERGYDVDVETDLFDLIWVGTETRDITDERWGGCAGYRAFWLMRWLGQIGGEKCGGGWYDPYGTHEDTYLEQARQTILGGARESVLFCYPSLQERTGPANVEALRGEMPALFDLAEWVAGEQPRGVASYRPMNAPAGGGAYLFDWLGMIGLPLVPAHEFPMAAPVAMFAHHATHDRDLMGRMYRFLNRGSKPLLMESASAYSKIGQGVQGAFVFSPPADPREMMAWSIERIQELRRAALQPLGMTLEGPAGTALYLLGARKAALENFTEDPAEMRLRLPEGGGWQLAFALGHAGSRCRQQGQELIVTMPPRTLVGLQA